MFDQRCSLGTGLTCHADDLTGEPATSEATDPTTASIERANVERERFRIEALRLSRALVAAYTEVEAATAERDFLRGEVERLTKIGDTLFVEGYHQAVEEIHDHFAKRKDVEVVAEVEKIWLRDKLT